MGGNGERTVKVIVKDPSGASGLNQVQESRKCIRSSNGYESGSEGCERLIQMNEALLQPPSGNPAWVELGFLFWTPYVDRDYDSTPSCSFHQCRIVLQPKVSPEPHYAAPHLSYTILILCNFK
eukprot:Gb_36580 [translate_table: standard]